MLRGISKSLFWLYFTFAPYNVYRNGSRLDWPLSIRHGGSRPYSPQVNSNLEDWFPPTCPRPRTRWYTVNCDVINYGTDYVVGAIYFLSVAFWP